MNNEFVSITLGVSLLITVAAYIKLSRLEGSYVNVLLPSLMVGVAANYLLPYVYYSLFGVAASRFAFVYVYATLALENVAFVYGYCRARDRIFRMQGRFSHKNFALIAWICIVVAALLYLPLLLQFRAALLHPREIYEQTRTGFGVQFYLSGVLAYLAVIFAMFARKSVVMKIALVTAACVILFLHGSKGMVLCAVFLVVLYQIYGRGKKIGLVPTAVAAAGVGIVALVLFVLTMSLGDGAGEAFETISEYSDYTRNAMLVIDEGYPRQYGKLTLEANVIALVPRALMPSKPKDFGAMRLDEEFYPDSMDLDQGVPSFGMGLQYADFGGLAIVYLVVCGFFRGWLARIFVNRVRTTKHPADFFMVAFLADLQLFPVGGAGWLLPEAFWTAIGLRFVSTLGARQTYREARGTTWPTPRFLVRPESSGLPS